MYRNIISPGFPADYDQELTTFFRQNLDVFIERYLKIRPKTGEICPLILNAGQRIIYDKIQEIRTAGNPVRIIILKARQLGSSTLSEAIMFCRARLWPQSNCLIVAHDKPTAENIFNMTQLFYDALPPELRPMVKYRTRSQITFDNPKEHDRVDNPGLMSEIRIATAKNATIARGFKLDACHLSEAAFWQNPEETMTAILQAVPEEPETFVIVESTARGAGGVFYEMWKEAVSGDTLWVPIFLPYWIEDEYEDALDPEKLDFMRRNLSKYEQKLKEDYLDQRFPEERSYGKLSWRRRKIFNACDGSLTKFNSEYAPTAQEAFTSQGECVFDLDAIRYYADNTVTDKGTKVSILVNQYGKIYPVDDPSSSLTIWERPQLNVEYVIGCDAALGVQRENTRTRRDGQAVHRRVIQGDYSVAEVFNNRREQVAEFRGHIDPLEFAVIVARLGEYYNWALVYPETANDSGGYGLQYGLKEIYPPGRLGLNLGWNKRGPRYQPTKIIGFRPRNENRSIIVGVMQKELRRGADKIDKDLLSPDDRKLPKLVLRSKVLCRELTSYVIKKNGDVGARDGTNDDTVVATGLALLALDQIPNAISPPQNKEEVLWYHPETGVSDEVSGSSLFPSWMDA